MTGDVVVFEFRQRTASTVNDFYDLGGGQRATIREYGVAAEYGDEIGQDVLLVRDERFLSRQVAQGVTVKHGRQSCLAHRGFATRWPWRGRPGHRRASRVNSKGPFGQISGSGPGNRQPFLRSMPGAVLGRTRLRAPRAPPPSETTPPEIS